MPAPTQYTDTNLTTSLAGYFANQLTSVGYAVYWQATAISSGVGTAGSITLVPEFPNEPNFLVLGPRPRVPNEALIPAFSVRIAKSPYEEARAGLGEDLFRQRAEVVIDGFVENRVQHLAFGTMLRNWFRGITYIPIYDWDDNPTTPALIDGINTYTENRQVERIELPNVPNPLRYYLNMTAELVYYD